MATLDARRRITADRRDLLHYRVKCPFCGEAVGPRFVTREHLDVQPSPPYAATVRCPRCREEFEVVFRAGT
jgi:phage terminase large subunit GpA-like protein